MKKSLLLSLAAAFVIPATAQISTGYYRVENYMTHRYAYIVDNKGSINWTTTEADLQAIKLWKGFDKAACDPASVLYFDHKGGKEYNVAAQGTSVYDMIDYNLRLTSGNDNTWYAYGQKDNMVKYLGDGEAADVAEGYMCTSATGSYRRWYITGITPDGDNYFGIKPEVTVGGKFYASMFASFPMSPYSQGMKMYAITLVDQGMAVKTEITGTAPGGCPILIECSYAGVSDNRMNVGGSGAMPADNMLRGVYFDNDDGKHWNRTAFDTDTMRVLGTCKDGSLGFVSAGYQYIPANKAYLLVPKGTPEELKIVTYEEYLANRQIYPTGVTVSPEAAALRKGETTTFTATVTPADATDKSVTWTSSAPGVASVDGAGKVTAVGAGSATITATTSNGLTATATVTVTVPATSITVEPATLALNNGASAKLTATVLPGDASNKSVTWTTGDAAVAAVSADGIVTATGNGTTTITATTADGTALSASCAVTVTTAVTSITLTPDYYEGQKGDSFDITAEVYPDDATDRSVTWSSSAPEVATVDADGHVEILEEGIANISATSNDGSAISGYCRVVATSDVILATSITVEPTTYEAIEGSEFTLTATVLPENVSFPEVLFTTNHSSIATVDNTGLVKIVGVGECEITAYTTDGTNLSAVCRVTGVSGVEEIIAPGTTADVYDTKGVLVARDADTATLRALPEGIYIVGGRKVVL